MLLLTTILITSGCVNQEGNGSGTIANDNTSVTMSNISYSDNIENVELFHFHSSQQCQSCINVDKCAEDAVNKYFSEEQDSGLMYFAHINKMLLRNLNINHTTIQLENNDFCKAGAASYD